MRFAVRLYRLRSASPVAKVIKRAPHVGRETTNEDLMMDEDVTKKSGIYSYVLTGEEKHLNSRAVSDNQKSEAYERQKGICVRCQKHFELNEMEADHATPWHEGGKTSAENCQLLCKDDNRRKSGK